MADFIPHAGDHAIVEGVIAVHFSQHIVPETLQGLSDALSPRLKPLLPDVATAPVFAFQFTVDQGTNTNVERGLGEVSFRRMKPDNTPAVMFRAMADFFSVNFLAYPGWAAALRESLQLFQLALEAAEGTGLTPVSSSMRFIDQFTSEQVNASASDLFTRDSPFLTPNCFESGPRWHCHTGWFDLSEGEILHQLNVNSILKGSTVEVRIDHNQIRRFGEVKLGDLLAPDSPVNFREGLESMHNANKRCLDRLLSADTVQRIKLWV